MFPRMSEHIFAPVPDKLNNDTSRSYFLIFHHNYTNITVVRNSEVGLILAQLNVAISNLE